MKQIKKNLKRQLQRSSRKNSFIMIQKEVMIVAKNIIEVKKIIIRHERLKRELRLSARLQQKSK